jgi:hypothetical protein
MTLDAPTFPRRMFHGNERYTTEFADGTVVSTISLPDHIWETTVFWPRAVNRVRVVERHSTYDAACAFHDTIIPGIVNGVPS